MSYRKSMVKAMLASSVLAVLPASTVLAQASNYPAFQKPTVARNELNFAVADGDVWGTSFIFQWRKGMAARSQLSLDAGLSDPDGFGASSYFVLGGQYGYQLARATRDMPIDALLTFGLNGAFGDFANFFRFPIGVSAGHRFPLEGQMAITPYVHPRVSFDVCSECGGGGGSDSDVGLNFDIGANFEFTPQLAVRFGAGFGGSNYFDQGNFGLSLAWTPGYTRPRGRR
jgi:hypothetical protein